MDVFGRYTTKLLENKMKLVMFQKANWNKCVELYSFNANSFDDIFSYIASEWFDHPYKKQIYVVKNKYAISIYFF